MKKLLLSVLALGAMSSVALAEPVTLTPAQMDQVTAGAFFQSFNRQTNVNVTKQTAVAVNVGGGAAIAANRNLTEQENEIEN